MQPTMWPRSRSGIAVKPDVRRSLRLLCALLVATPLYGQRGTQAGPYHIYSWTSTPRFAERVLSIVQRYDELPGLPAAAPAFGQPIRIYLAPDARTFRQLTAGRAPEWGAGVAAPQEGVIVLRAYGGTRGAYA